MVIGGIAVSIASLGRRTSVSSSRPLSSLLFLVSGCSRSTLAPSCTAGTHVPSRGMKKGVALGVYEGDGAPKLTPAAYKYDQITGGKLVELLKLSGPAPKLGKTRLFYGLEPEYPVVAISGLGRDDLGYSELEEVDERREAIRAYASVACRALRDTAGVTHVSLDTAGDPEASAEGALLGMWAYDDLKNRRKDAVAVEPYPTSGEGQAEWEKGKVKAEAQNVSRRLAETPANLMTPTIFGGEAERLLSPLGVKVVQHDREWAKQKGMGCFLSVSQGSAQPPVFLELSYCSQGAQGKKPIVLVGKGITFDSGGISIKPSARMDQMRGDMGGGATVFASFYAAASLKLNVNLVGLVPLSENLPSSTATKPGDVFYAMNGKTVQVDNTDAEGRLVLADALCYADTFNPRVVIDMATLTGAIRVALGAGAAGTFTNSTEMWKRLHEAGIKTGDRVWRMPVWNIYTRQVQDCSNADLNNIGKHSPASGACVAAAFLKEFTTAEHWVHMDIAGTMENKDEVVYLGKGFTGRPLRTIVEFLVGMQE